MAHILAVDDDRDLCELLKSALQRAGRSLYTGDASRPQGGHTGMGLWFARAVALEHGGGLELFNADGACAVLTVRL